MQTLTNSNLVKQLYWRTLLSIALIIVLIGGAAWGIQTITYNQKIAVETALFRKDCQENIDFIEKYWFQQFKVLAASLDRFMLSGRWDPVSLKDFFSSHLRDDALFYLVLTDGDGKVMFGNDRVALAVGERFTPGGNSGWHYSLQKNKIFHFNSHEFSTGTGGHVNLVVMTPVDATLLNQIAFSDITLSLFWQGRMIASSEVAQSAPLSKLHCTNQSHDDGTDVQECLLWSPFSRESPVLVIHKHIHPFFSFRDLVGVVSGVLAVSVLLLYALLGSWFWSQVRRIRRLGEFCSRYDLDRPVAPMVMSLLEQVGRPRNDEIASVAESLAQLVRGVEQKIQEREFAARKAIESEQQLREITSTIGDGVLVLDQSGKVTFFNPQGERLLGWKAEELLGQNSHQTLHCTRPDGSCNPGESCPVHQTVCSGIPARIYEDYFVRRDGSFLPVALSSAPILRQGVLAGAVVTFQDITEHLKMKKMVEESQQRFRELFNTANDAIYVIALTEDGSFGRFLEVNDATCLRYGYSREEFLQLTPAAINPTEERNDLHALAAHIRRQRHVTFERRHQTRHGQIIPVEVNARLFEFQGQTAVLSLARDISERKHNEQIMQENEQRFRSLVNSLRDAVLVFNSRGSILLLNHNGSRMFGYEKIGFLDRPVATLFSQDRGGVPWALSLPRFEASDQDNLALTMEGTARRLNGEEFPVEVSLSSWTRHGERLYAAVIRDISERQLLEKRDLRAFINRIAISALLEVALEPLSLRRKLEVAMDIIHTVPRWATQAKGSIMLLNDHGDLELVVERHLSHHLLDRCRRIPMGHCLCGRAAQSKELVFSNEVDSRHEISFDGMQPHGHYCVPILLHGQCLGVLNLYVEAGHLQDHDEVAFLTTVANTLAGLIERGRIEEKIRHMANHDLLTGLPNRAMFHEHLQQQLRQTARRQRALVLAFLDLDRFKQVNDTLGHEAGDELLKLVTVRLRQCLRQSDILARLGGDEFTIILPEVEHPSDAATVAEKIIRSLQEPFDILGHSCRIGVSIGMSCYPKDGETAEDLLQMADQAMYSVKHSGRNAFAFFND
ncbi:MAG: PAS domain S-box protein [Magnetococcales bacterium]|nr:PAS domain S-box protein [Magnetococcales bacterium]